MGHHGGYRKGQGRRHGFSAWLSRLFGGERHGRDRYYGEIQEKRRHGAFQQGQQDAPQADQENCPSCRIPVDMSAKFCQSCGIGLTRECKQCNATLFTTAQFCSKCGKKCS